MNAARAARAAGLLTTALLVISPRVDARDWVIARSSGFLVVSDAGEKKARTVAHQFEQIRNLFQQVFKARVHPGRLVVVFAFKDERGLAELLAAPGGRSLPAGIFSAGIDKHFVLLRLDAASPHPYRVIYHEYVHLLARLNFRWLPLWLNEGLAEFYATVDVDDEEVRWGQVWDRHVSVLRQAPMIPLAELIAAGRDSAAYNEGFRRAQFYAQSAMLTHYFFFGDPKRRGQLRRFAELLDQDVPYAEAIAQAFGDLRPLEGDLRSYVQQPAFHGIKARVQLDAPSITTLALRTEEADTLRADFMVRRGSLRTARKLLESALQRDPGQGLAHEALGVAEALEGRRAEAVRHLAEAVRLAPASYVAPFHLGIINVPRDAGDRDRRSASLRSAIRLNPAFAPAYAALSRLLMEGEPTEEAVTLASRAVALEPGSGRYRVLWWYALDRMGRKEEAARIEAPLRRAALMDGGTLEEMVKQLEDIGRAEDAEGLLRGARSTNGAASTLLASFLSERQRWDEAEAIRREELAKQPDSATALNNLAYTLAESGRNLDEALRFVERALKKSPGRPTYLDTKGFILLRMNRLEQAETVLREAAAAYPDAEILAHLGDVLLARGKREEALAQYARALETPDVAQRLRESIQAKLNPINDTASAP